MRKKYFFIAGIIVLFLLAIGAGYGWYLFHKPHAGVSGITAVAHIKSAGLYDRFQKNEGTADSQYLGQVLEVEGPVSDVEKTDSTLSIILECGAGAGGGINCSMAGGPAGKIPLPAKGAILTVKGRCTGFLMDVNMVDCVIQNIKQ
jgi:hypothetical protein